MKSLFSHVATAFPRIGVSSNTLPGNGFISARYEVDFSARHGRSTPQDTRAKITDLKIILLKWNSSEILWINRYARFHYRSISS
jgi:hypothetical protein